MEDAITVRKVDRLGVVLVVGGALALTWMPFIIVKANRIAAGKPQLLTQLLAQPAAICLVVLLVAAALAALFLHNQLIRLGIATLAIGILMLPLGYIAAHVPFAADIGVKGIGVAPALVALVIYSLLPIVANTVVGLMGVDPSVRDSAAGMGLTRRQILTGIDLPLAFPVILTGIRIVLVQAIGLVTVAALIGGGGFGLFIFQGIGQTANDLVLLGAVPTVILAFSSAVILDAVIDSIRGQRT